MSDLDLVNKHSKSEVYMRSELSASRNEEGMNTLFSKLLTLKSLNLENNVHHVLSIELWKPPSVWKHHESSTDSHLPFLVLIGQNRTYFITAENQQQGFHNYCFFVKLCRDCLAAKMFCKAVPTLDFLPSILDLGKNPFIHIQMHNSA